MEHDRSIRKLRRTAITVALVAAAWFLAVGPLALGGPASYIKVAGHSMEPTYVTGDLVVTREQASYRPGDVVAFRADGGIVIHRIVGGDADGFTTQGDNNSFTDPWTPTEEDILGTAWIHLPDGGDHLATATSPEAIGGTAAAAVAVGRSGVRRRRRRPRSGTAATSTPGRAGTVAARSSTTPLPSLAPFAVAASAAAAAALLTVAAWIAPLHDHVTEEGTTPIAEATSALTAHQVDSTLGPAHERALTLEGGPALTQLTDRLGVTYTYRLLDDAPVRAATVGLDLTVTSGPEGWERSQTLAAPATTIDREVTVSGSIDLMALRDLIASTSAETGLNAPSYEVRIVPTAVPVGAAGGEVPPAEPVALTWTPATLTLESPLSATVETATTTTAEAPHRLRLPALAVPVATARWAALALVAALGVSALLAGRLRGRWDLAAIRARGGASLVEAARPVGGHATDGPITAVASFNDVLRVAKAQGTVVVHAHDEAGHHFTVHDGPSCFRYTRRQGADRSP